MQNSLTAIVAWLSVSFGLPAIYEHPRIEFVPPTRMEAVQFRGWQSGLSTRAAAERAQTADPGSREVEALYDDSHRTIYLPEGWTGTTPTEVSVLVHEMVHHLQNLGGLKYDCPQARERLAYVAQNRWLERFGRNLMEEFELDPVTVLVRTRCMH
jgi:hypothetical protein